MPRKFSSKFSFSFQQHRSSVKLNDVAVYLNWKVFVFYTVCYVVQKLNDCGESHVGLIFIKKTDLSMVKDGFVFIIVVDTERMNKM